MIKNIWCYLVILVAFTSCQTMIHSGTSVTEEEIAKIESKKLTKTQVAELIGEPDIVPEYSKHTWYYVHRDLTKRAFLPAKLRTQEIVKVTFSNDKVSAVEIIETENIEGIETVKDTTVTAGNQKNALQEYLGNLGKYNKTKKPKRR